MGKVSSVAGNLLKVGLMVLLVVWVWGARRQAGLENHVARRHRDTASLAGNAILRDIACDYAFYLLWRSDAPDWVIERKKSAIRQLEQIADGKLMLDQGEETAAPLAGSACSGGRLTPGADGRAQSLQPGGSGRSVGVAQSIRNTHTLSDRSDPGTGWSSLRRYSPFLSENE